MFKETRVHWPLMSAYGRFEQVVTLVLSALIALVILLALIQLVLGVVPLIVGGALAPLDYEVFQALFGLIMTLLIAMEFNHSIVQVALRRQSIVRAKTVVLIALLALSRKLIILDAANEPAMIVSLAGAALALGAVYWLLRERDVPRSETPGDR
jgi:uncharacterized membrane protein (DUF373 family)